MASLKENQTSSSEKQSILATIVTIIILFLFYPIGVIVMWVWPKWNKSVKIILTVPIVLIIIFTPIVVLLLPRINPIIEKELEPIVNCVNLCDTDDIFDPCVRKCQENALKE